jgi:hypothetical protein
MTAHPILQPRLQRGDRSVQRVRMRLPEGVPQFRVSFAVEESLRLATLPGEDEGRTYYFRRVSLPALPSAAPRSRWIEAFQSALHEIADRAINGRDPRALGADAVYFHSQQDALESFLALLLRAADPMPWFAPMVSGAPQDALDASPAEQFVSAIERLRELPAGWFAAATSLFAALPADPRPLATLLASAPPAVIRGWLRELGADTAIRLPAAPVSAEKQRRLLAVFAASGYAPGEASSTGAERELPFLWLAAAAVAAEHPAELQRGSLPTLARELLEQLGRSLPARPLAPGPPAPQDPPHPAILPPQNRRDEAAPQSSGPTSEEHILEQESIPTPALIPAERDLVSDSGLDLSLPTQAAGLYFLLNVLKRLGIEAVLAARPHLEACGFLPCLLFALAAESGVASDDPALDWPRAELARLKLKQADNSDCPLFRAAGSWPRNAPAPPPPPGLEISAANLVRIWALATRRWCWRHTRAGLKEIIARPGRILLSRADLDVTLPLDSADLRLRRAGLDLDPCWLPWFGRVVRFHYHAQPPNVRPRRPGGLQ